MKAISAIFLVAAGVLLMLFNNGVLPVEYRDVVFSWPSLLCVFGIIGLFARHGRFFGLVMLAIGAFYLLPKTGLGVDFLHSNLWPIALVAAGLIVLYYALRPRRQCVGEPCCSGGRDEADSEGYIAYDAVFSGCKRKLSIANLRGGEINSVFGGVELDFSECTLAPGRHRLCVSCVFGGTELYVPADWQVELRVHGVFGNFVDKRPHSVPVPTPASDRVLVLEVRAVFGGGELKLV